MDLRIAVISAIAFLRASEHSLQIVILALADRIELVIVATSALNSRADERIHHCRNDVIAINVSSNLPVDAVLSNIAQRAFIPRARGKEAHGDSGVGVIRK